MKPQLEFQVVAWANRAKTLIRQVRLFGADHNGETVDRIIEFPAPGAEVDNVHRMVAGMNKGQYRPRRSRA